MTTFTFGLLAVALFAPQQATRAPETQPSAAIEYVTPFELSDDHEALAGKTISMIGNVDDAFGTRAFTIDDDVPWNRSGDILVIAPELRKDFAKAAYLRLRGRVVPFEDAAVQQFIAATPALAEDLRDFDGRAIVLADSVTGPAGEDLTVGGKDARR
jgi:hypothetical protein